MNSGQSSTKWLQALVKPKQTIREAMQVIDASAMKAVAVVNDEMVLLGLLTDGDIRRAILSGIELESPVHQVMNKTPIIAKKEDNHETILTLMKCKELQHIPIVTENGVLCDFVLREHLITKCKKENIVILMAGGLGQRLMPLTADCPKPMLQVGNKPILETLLESFIEAGFYKFYISVNYKAEMIKSYFGDGNKWQIEIKYLEEKSQLGTAGALSLLNETPTLPVIIINGDIITRLSFSHLLDFHCDMYAHATMCVREYQIQVPYGVVQMEQGQIVKIQEKPSHRFFVNAGIYALSPEAIKMVPRNTYLDMPDLFDKLKSHNMECVAFPLREYWRDIGQHEDFALANIEYTDAFRLANDEQT